MLERGGVPVAEELTTPGPWAWRWAYRGRPQLVHPSHGVLIVMDAVRDGMQGATVRFAERNPTDLGGIMCKAEHFFPEQPGRRVSDFQPPLSPDMRLIAASPNLLALARIIGSAYSNDPGTSDLDDEQPVRITLGVVRQAWAALAKVDR